MANRQLQYQLSLNTASFVSAAQNAGNAVQQALNPNTATGFNNAVGQSKGAFGTMGSALKKVGAVMATVFAADKIKDFFVDAVKNAATIKATEAQFEQVFGNNVEIVQSKLEEMGQSMGILPERLKPGLSQLTSMFKGLGVESQEATEMASLGMNMAADAAAFYDKSLEEAQGNLTSFIKGNYEGGESIGLFANATQIASWCSKTLGKDFNKMSEAEKQNTRLQFAKEMMEKSGAMGQAAREADGLENQMGNLKSAWEQFTAKIGTPILEKVVIPALMGIVKVLDELGEWFSNIDTSAFAPFIDMLKESAGAIKEDLGEAFEAIKPIFAEIEPLFEPLMEALTVVAQILGEGLAKACKVLAPFVADIVKHFAELAKPVLEAISALKPLADVILAFLGDRIQALFPAFKAGLDIIFGVLKVIIEPIKEIIKFISKLAEAIKLAFSGDLSGALELAVQAFITMKDNIDKTVTELAQKVWEGIKGLIKGVVSFWTTGWNALISPFKETFSNIKKALVQKCTEIKTAVVNKFTEIKNKLTNTVGQIKTSVVNKFTTIKTGLTNVVSQIKTSVVNKFTEIKNGVVNKVSQMVSSAVRTAKGFPSKFISCFTSIPSKMASIGSNIISGLLKGLTNSWSKITSWVSEKANWITNKFKAVLKIKSPSRAFVQIGEFIDMGLVKGLTNEEDSINDKVIGLAKSIPANFNKMLDTEFTPNLTAVSKSSSQMVVKNPVAPIVQVVVEGDIGAVVNKVSTKIARQTGLMIGGRV